MRTLTTDLLCIGAGLAARRAAVEVAAAGFQALRLAPASARRSQSGMGRSGMLAALGAGVMSQGDSPDLHFQDTVRAGDWGGDQAVIRLLAETAPAEARLLAHWGAPWDRAAAGRQTRRGGGKTFQITEKKERDGLIQAAHAHGSSKWRACRVADFTGQALLTTLDNRAAQLGVLAQDRMEVVGLIHDGHACHGAVARCLRTGELVACLARATLVATGGFGRLFRHATASLCNDGGAHAALLDTGLVSLANLEAVQCHPLALAPADIPLPRRCLDEGGQLLDADETRFLAEADPDLAERAPRDAVCRAMQRRLRQGRGVASGQGEHLWLDLRHLGEKRLRLHLPEVVETCRNLLGLDPAVSLVPVRPAQDFCMGGVRVDVDCRVPGLAGLFAAGEAACWDLHGFNRLEGNAIAESLVAGGVAGRGVLADLHGRDARLSPRLAAEQTARHAAAIRDLAARAGGEHPQDLLDLLRDVLDQAAGPSRERQSLERATAQLQDLHRRARRCSLRAGGQGPSPELGLALKLPGQIRLALCLVQAALARTESRGSHHREDFPARDDARWLVRSLSRWPEGAAQPVLSHEPASATWPLPPAAPVLADTEPAAPEPTDPGPKAD